METMHATALKESQFADGPFWKLLRALFLSSFWRPVQMEYSDFHEFEGLRAQQWALLRQQLAAQPLKVGKLHQESKH